MKIVITILLLLAQLGRALPIKAEDVRPAKYKQGIWVKPTLVRFQPMTLNKLIN